MQGTPTFHVNIYLHIYLFVCLFLASKTHLLFSQIIMLLSFERNRSEKNRLKTRLGNLQYDENGFDHGLFLSPAKINGEVKAFIERDLIFTCMKYSVQLEVQCLVEKTAVQRFSFINLEIWSYPGEM